MIKLRAPLRVCHLASGDGWGGLEAMVMNLLRMQQADPGYDISLIVLNDGRLYREALAEGITVHLLPENELSAWELGRLLRRTLKSVRPQLLHTHRYKENFYSFLMCPGLGIRPVVTMHGYGPSSFRPEGIKTALLNFVSFRLAHRARARFVAVSGDLRRLYRPNDSECVIIPNGIPVSPELIPDRAASDGRPVIGWVGRLVPVKSVGTLLEAVAHMRSSGTDATALLVGDGPERAALVEHAARLGIQEQVQFVGYVDDLSPLLARMDVFALPSLHEGAPMALLEAMAAGVPGVVARVGGIPEMIGESGAARLVDGHDPVAWAHAITEVLGDRARADQMVTSARRLVTNRFSVDAMHARYGEVYHAVVTN